MRRVIATLVGCCMLALVPAGVGWAQAAAAGDSGLLQILVDSAKTPAEHQALARYFQAQAADAKALAERHQKMAKSYSGKPGELRNMNKHCDQIAKLNLDLAAQYEAMAKAEETAASAR